jgi:hypothetical protein
MTMSVHEALARLQRMIGEGDYTVLAVAVEDGCVDVAVQARDAACAECLVPKEMMRGIADECLTGTGHRVRALHYPDDHPDDAPAGR